MKHHKTFERISLDADLLPYGEDFRQESKWFATHCGKALHVYSYPTRPSNRDTIYSCFHKNREVVSRDISKVVRWAELKR